MRYMLHDGIARRMFIILLSAGDRCACRSIYCFYWRRRANSYFENCTRERLPRDRQLVGFVWSTSIGRNLNVISHKSQRVIAVVVTNLMVPRMQPKMYNNHIWADKWRSSAYDENRSCVHATTQWFQMEIGEPNEKDASGTKPGPFRFYLLWKPNQQNFSIRCWFVCYLCVWTPLWLSWAPSTYRCTTFVHLISSREWNWNLPHVQIKTD